MSFLCPRAESAKIPYTYIGNIARAVELSLGNEKCFGGTFIVGDTQSYSLRTIVLELANAMGISPRIVPVPRALAYTAAVGFEMLAKVRGSTPLLDRGRVDTLTNSASYSIAAFQAATGYEPPYSLRQSIGRIVSWYVGK